MQKITLIIGSSEVEILNHALNIAEKCEHHQIVKIKAKNRNLFQFGPCDANTKILIVHDMISTDGLFEFYHMVNEMEINERGKDPCTIHPQVIITSTKITSDQLPTDESFTRRFNVMDMNAVNRF